MRKSKEILSNPDFLALLTQEAINLKKYATNYEINQLVIKNVNATSMSSCIYGQMTGSCNSPRAFKLMNLCCTNVMKNRGDEVVINGSIKNEKERKIFYGMSFYSPIELYISANLIIVEGTSKKRVRNLVNFLKGKTETFVP